MRHLPHRSFVLHFSQFSIVHSWNVCDVIISSNTNIVSSNKCNNKNIINNNYKGIGKSKNLKKINYLNE